MSGLRQVLMSDLTQAGQFEIIDAPSISGEITSERIAELGAGLKADVVIVGELSEGSPNFIFLLRAYSSESGYNVGSRELNGTYAEIKFLQDRLLGAALELLRSQVSNQRKAEITEGHTKKVGAVAALGEADVALQEHRYVDALGGLSKSRAMDTKFKAAQIQMDQRSNEVISKLTNPDDIGKAYAYIGDATRAMAQYDLALKKNPNDISALIGKGELLLKLGNTAEAIALFRKATALEPQNPYAALGLAKAFQQSGNTKESLAAYEKAKGLGVTDPEVYESLGTLYASAKNPKLSAEAFQTAGALSERKADLERAQAAYELANKFAPTAASLMAQAEVHISSGDLGLAIVYLSKAASVDPTNSTVLSRLGYAYYLNRQLEDARKKFQRAFELNPANFEANLYLGVLLMDDRDTQPMAIKHFETAVRLRPSDHDTNFRLAHAYILVGKAGDAVSLLEKFVRANSRDPKAHKELGEAYAAAEDYARAEVSFLRAIELQPGFREAHESLVRILVKTNQRDRAFAEIGKIYEIDAAENLLVRSGRELLLQLTPAEFLDAMEQFPKRVMGEFSEVPINQVVLAHLIPNQNLKTLLYYYFYPYTTDESVVQRDLEMALFVKYRVISKTILGTNLLGRFSQNIFDRDTSVRPLALQSSLDGIFGFKIVRVAQDHEQVKLSVGISLYSVPDGRRYAITDPDLIPKVTYPKKSILVFNKKIFFSYSLVFLLCFVPFSYFSVYRGWVRGRGNLRVIINYDPRLESFLTLKLATKQEKERDPKLVIVKDKTKYEKRKYKDLLRQKGAWVRKMVGKNTLFEKVPAREYFCYLYGTIEDGSSVAKTTVGNYYMVQKVRIDRDKTNEIVFQLEKEEAFVTIFVRKGDEDVIGAEIRVDGSKEVLFSRGGQGAFTYCKKGDHRILVTHGGRTVEQRFTVFELEDKIINVDLQTAEEAEATAVSDQGLSKTAAQFEEQGRLKDAARLYEKAGSTDQAVETRARAFLTDGDTDAAAKEYIRGKEFLKAAKIYEDVGDSEKARYLYGLDCYQRNDFRKAAEYLEGSKHHSLLSKIYEQLGDPKKARHATANAFLEQGQKLEAAQVLIQAEEYEKAAEIYEGLHDFLKAAMLYAKGGNYSVAGDLFAQAGDKQKAAMAFEKGGLYEQAISLYRELGETDKVAELYIRDQRYIDAAGLYREQGLIDEAIAMCQKVPSFHTDYPKTRVLLGQMFSDKGMDELALQTFKEIRSEHADLMDENALYVLASLHEKQGELTEALEIFEELIKRDFHFRDVSIRIKELKAKVTTAAKARQAAPSMGETIAAGAPMAPSRYELMDELGRGAMGIVYKAKDKMLDRIVAFKTLPHTLKNDPAALENLKKEAQTAARLNHPNIVTIYDVGQEKDHYFIAMEFVEGKTLQDVLKRVKKVDPTNFKHIAKSLCDVVGYAHEKHVIHRDIKPSNILLTNARLVKLMDFGLAKVLADMSIDKTMLRGTPLYMSPEQILGKDIDHRADLYALGIIFYEMLAGRPPFIEGDILYAHLHTQPPPLTDLVPNLPGPLVAAIMRVLAKEKTARPATAKELANSLGL